jgi:SAM-dependent methyltransferase/predicted Ser/Thr protein kinase
VCLLFFNNTYLFADNTSESTLISAPAFFADENREAYLQARLMCHIIDKLAKSKKARSVRDIPLDEVILWAKENDKPPYPDWPTRTFEGCQFRLLDNQVIIYLPACNVSIRYYGRDKAEEFIPYMDRSRTETVELKDTNINRQIFYKTLALPAPKVEDVETKTTPRRQPMRRRPWPKRYRGTVKDFLGPFAAAYKDEDETGGKEDKERFEDEKKLVGLSEALKPFGIRILENNIDFSDVPKNVNWVMDEIRDIEARPIARTLEKMPIAKLIYPLENIEEVPPISREGSSSTGIYIGLIEWQGESRPAAIKRIDEPPQAIQTELEFAQVYDCLGIAPRFYGVIQDKAGNIVGYAMQVAIGEATTGDGLSIYYPELDESEDIGEVRGRPFDIGLSPSGEYMVTRRGKVIAIDAGGGQILGDEDSETYEAFIRRMNESAGHVTLEQIEKRVGLVEALKPFGIRIAENIDFSDVPENVDWVMDNIREQETGPIAMELEEVPIAKLVYPLQDVRQLPAMSIEGSHSAGVYIGLIEWHGKTQPVAIKLIDSSLRTILDEIEYAQVHDRLGISPRFYGAVQNETGDIIGYAMQVAIGEAMSMPKLMQHDRELFDSENRRQISRRARNIGLRISGECLVTRKNQVIAIDAGDADVADNEKYNHFIREMNEADTQSADDPGKPPFDETDLQHDEGRIEPGETPGAEEKKGGYSRKPYELLKRKTDGEPVDSWPTCSVQQMFGIPGIRQNLDEQHVLVIGCGGGPQVFASVLNGAEKSIGVDVDENSIEVARLLAPFIHDPALRHDLLQMPPFISRENVIHILECVLENRSPGFKRVEPNNMEFIACDARNLSPIQDNSVDGVAVSYVVAIERGILDKDGIRSTVQEAVRVVKPGGTLFIRPLHSAAATTAKEQLALWHLEHMIEALKVNTYAGKRLVSVKDNHNLFMVVEDPSSVGQAQAERATDSTSSVQKSTTESPGSIVKSSNIVNAYSSFIQANLNLISTLLAESREPVFFPISRKLIDETPDRKSVIEFLNTLQGFKNAYVLVYETEGLISILSEGEKEGLYGIAEKPIRKEHEAYMGRRENTVAIFPVEAEIKKVDLQIEMETVRGALRLRPDENVIISPVGARNDPLGLIRGSVLGLNMIHIARHERDYGEAYKDKDFIRRFVNPALTRYRSLCEAEGVEGFDLTAEDLIYIAIGDDNELIKALRRLINLLPIIPIYVAEEVRRVYENTREALEAM